MSDNWEDDKTLIDPGENYGHQLSNTQGSNTPNTQYNEPFSVIEDHTPVPPPIVKKVAAPTIPSLDIPTPTFDRNNLWSILDDLQKNIFHTSYDTDTLGLGPERIIYDELETDTERRSFLVGLLKRVAPTADHRKLDAKLAAFEANLLVENKARAKATEIEKRKRLQAEKKAATEKQKAAEREAKRLAEEAKEARRKDLLEQANKIQKSLEAPDYFRYLRRDRSKPIVDPGTQTTLSPTREEEIGLKIKNKSEDLTPKELAYYNYKRTAERVAMVVAAAVVVAVIAGVAILSYGAKEGGEAVVDVAGDVVQDILHGKISPKDKVSQAEYLADAQRLRTEVLAGTPTIAPLAIFDETTGNIVTPTPSPTATGGFAIDVNEEIIDEEEEPVISRPTFAPTSEPTKQEVEVAQAEETIEATEIPPTIETAILETIEPTGFIETPTAVQIESSPTPSNTPIPVTPTLNATATADSGSTTKPGKSEQGLKSTAETPSATPTTTLPTATFTNTPEATATSTSTNQAVELAAQLNSNDDNNPTDQVPNNVEVIPSVEVTPTTLHTNLEEDLNTMDESESTPVPSLEYTNPYLYSRDGIIALCSTEADQEACREFIENGYSAEINIVTDYNGIPDLVTLSIANDEGKTTLMQFSREIIIPYQDIYGNWLYDKTLDGFTLEELLSDKNSDGNPLISEIMRGWTGITPQIVRTVPREKLEAAINFLALDGVAFPRENTTVNYHDSGDPDDPGYEDFIMPPYPGSEMSVTETFLATEWESKKAIFLERYKDDPDMIAQINRLYFDKEAYDARLAEIADMESRNEVVDDNDRPLYVSSYSTVIFKGDHKFSGQQLVRVATMRGQDETNRGFEIWDAIFGNSQLLVDNAIRFATNGSYYNDILGYLFLNKEIPQDLIDELKAKGLDPKVPINDLDTITTGKMSLVWLMFLEKQFEIGDLSTGYAIAHLSPLAASSNFANKLGMEQNPDAFRRFNFTNDITSWNDQRILGNILGFISSGGVQRTQDKIRNGDIIVDQAYIDVMNGVYGTWYGSNVDPNNPIVIPLTNLSQIPTTYDKNSEIYKFLEAYINYYGSMPGGVSFDSRQNEILITSQVVKVKDNNPYAFVVPAVLPEWRDNRQVYLPNSQGKALPPSSPKLTTNYRPKNTKTNEPEYKQFNKNLTAVSDAELINAFANGKKITQVDSTSYLNNVADKLMSNTKDYEEGAVLDKLLRDIEYEPGIPEGFYLIEDKVLNEFRLVAKQGSDAEKFIKSVYIPDVDKAFSNYSKIPEPAPSSIYANLLLDEAGQPVRSVDGNSITKIDSFDQFLDPNVNLADDLPDDLANDILDWLEDMQIHNDPIPDGLITSNGIVMIIPGSEADFDLQGFVNQDSRNKSRFEVEA